MNLQDIQNIVWSWGISLTIGPFLIYWVMSKLDKKEKLGSALIYSYLFILTHLLIYVAIKAVRLL